MKIKEARLLTCLGVALLVVGGCANKSSESTSQSTQPTYESQPEQMPQGTTPQGEAPEEEWEQPEASTAPAPPPPPPAGPAVTEAPEHAVSQAELEVFADVQLELASLEQRLARQAQAEPSQTNLQELQAEFQDEAVQIVEASELSQERFKELMALLERDPNLQRRVRAVIDQKLGG